MPALDLDPPALPARQAVPVQFSVLLQAGLGGGTALRALVAEAGPDARVIRVGNPLRAPLTIERILIQTGLVEAGLLTDEEAGQAMQQLLRRDDGDRTLLVIEQAETLSQAALQTLARLAHGSAGQAALLQVVFVGEPAFAGLVLATPDAGPIRAALPEPPAAASLVGASSVDTEPDADGLPSMTLPPVFPLRMPGVPIKAQPEPASWFQVLSTGTETKLSAAPAPVPSPARPRLWQMFWLLLLFFLAGAGMVLVAAVLFHR